MGASAWSARTPYAGSLAQSLRGAQEQVLATGDYLWPWEGIDPDYLEPEDLVPRPTTLEGLGAAKQVDEFWDAGTHTVLDMNGMAGQVDGDFCTVEPLTDEEAADRFGSAHPSAQDLERVAPGGQVGDLDDLVLDRWSGRCVVIHRGGQPSEVFFWGISGD